VRHLARLVAGGQEFPVEGAESLLEAALRAGLGVPYGCSNGNCGACKARIVAGSTRRTRFHDFRLTEAEKLQGYALMCCSTALSDVVIDTGIAQGAGDIPLQRVGAQVRRLEPLAADVLLLELVTPRSQRLRFLAGQSAVLDLGETCATLPIASCPCEERRLQFHLRRNAGDRRSDDLCGRLRPGAPVSVEGPVGDFVLRDGGARPLVFIAWGWQSFAPVKSIIEHALAQEAAASIELYWIAKDASEHYYPNLCRAWAQAIDGFRYALLVGDSAADGEIAATLAALGQLPERDFYVAGAAHEIAATRALLAGSGTPPARLSAWSPA
jgi:CDP-4-dehydro-6-deoxyglucose reductase